MIRDLVFAGAGALGMLVLEHGWGWVLGKIKTYAAKERAKAQNAIANFESIKTAIDAHLAPLSAQVSGLQTDIAAIKTKVGI